MFVLIGLDMVLDVRQVKDCVGSMWWWWRGVVRGGGGGGGHGSTAIVFVGFHNLSNVLFT